MRMVEDAKTNMENRRTTYNIYLDVEIAFHKIWQKELIVKIIQSNRIW